MARAGTDHLARRGGNVGTSRGFGVVFWEVEVDGASDIGRRRRMITGLCLLLAAGKLPILDVRPCY